MDEQQREARLQPRRRSGLLILLVLLVMALAVTATVGIVHHRKVERQLVTELGSTRSRVLELGREAEATRRAATARQDDLQQELDRCRAKPCPTCPPPSDGGADGKATRPAPSGRRPPPAPGAAASALGVDVNELVVRAQREYVERRFASARELARRALQLQSTHDGATRVLGASSCALKDRASASWAHERLGSGARVHLEALCRRSGIELP